MSTIEALSSETSDLLYATHDRTRAIPRNILYPKLDDPIFRNTARTVYLDSKYKITDEVELLEDVDYVTGEMLFKDWEKWIFADNLAREIALEGSPEYFEDMLKTLLADDSIRIVHMITGLGTDKSPDYPSQTFGYIRP